MASHGAGTGVVKYPKFESGDDSQNEERSSSGTYSLRVDTDTDSAIGDILSIPSSSVSVRSSIFENVEENGRTYHKYKEGSYLLPNDDKEQARLDLQHHLCKLTLRGKSHLAPIKPDLHNVLDFGTGTGIWAVEFADEYPSANVLGTDLSPIQPLFVPPNCRFEVSDATDEWVYAEKFDYIHGRLLAICFSDSKAVFQQAFNSLAPGGWFEMFDFSAKFDTLDDSAVGTELQRFSDLMIEGALKLGRDMTQAPKYKQYFKEIGFMDVTEVKFEWPFNTWPKGEYYKSLGRWYNEDFQQGLEGMSVATLTRAHGWTKEQVLEFLVGVRRDIDDKNIHAYLPLYVVYGRKPE